MIAICRTIICDYSDVYILIKETIVVPNTVTADANANNANKKLIFKMFPNLLIA